jgi:hypothetical protein
MKRHIGGAESALVLLDVGVGCVSIGFLSNFAFPFSQTGPSKPSHVLHEKSFIVLGDLARACVKIGLRINCPFLFHGL